MILPSIRVELSEQKLYDTGIYYVAVVKRNSLQYTSQQASPLYSAALVRIILKPLRIPTRCTLGVQSKIRQYDNQSHGIFGFHGSSLKAEDDGNGDKVTYTYDNLGRVKTATYSDGLELTYTYTGEGSLYSVTTEEDGAKTTYIYNYDSLDRLIASERLDGEESVIRARQAYDNVNRVVYQAWQLGDTVYTEGYTYNSTIDGSLNTFTTAMDQVLTMNYDGLRRLTGITGGVYGKTYTYRDVASTKTTMQVASVAYDLPTDQSFAYTYDNMGNIATYTDANGTMTYTYDAQGQLVSATDGTTTYSYTYDTVGNILVANGHSYTYDDPNWKDLLTAVDGETISYDDVGNPTSYYNGTRWTFGWEQGRRLTAATNGTTNLSFTYDADGLRTSKTVDGVKHTYLYASGKLLRESYGDTTIDFFYDTNGHPYALSHEIGDAEPVFYYYITNLQGDVMSIVDAQGAVVASYEYDPYGNIVTASGTLTEINPLRYRGYYYDSESGLYYLQSRYYDSEIGRFINADVFTSTGQGLLGNNMFAYCGNNPIARQDCSGKAFETVFDLVSLGFSIIEVAANPYDFTAWLGLAGDVIDVIPFVTGVGEVIRGVRLVDKAGNTLEIAEALDFTDDVHDTLRSLDRSSGFTRSTSIDGIEIHGGYKKGPGFVEEFKEYSEVPGIRPDYYDANAHVIYELKPFNPWSAIAGVEQLRRYNDVLGGNNIMRLEMY